MIKDIINIFNRLCYHIEDNNVYVEERKSSFKVRFIYGNNEYIIIFDNNTVQIFIYGSIDTSHYIGSPTYLDITSEEYNEIYQAYNDLQNQCNDIISDKIREVSKNL